MGIGNHREGPAGLELHPKPAITRLNRNAVIVGALVGVAVLVVAAATLVNNQRSLGSHQRGMVRDTGGGGADAFWKTESDGVPGRVVAEPVTTPVAMPVPVPAPEPEIVFVTTSTGDTEADRRMRRAMQSAPLVQGFTTTRSASNNLLERPSPTPSGRTFPSGELAGALGGAFDATDPTILQNNQAAKREFLNNSAIGEAGETLKHMVREPISPYEVTAGTVIPAVMVTHGHSDLPGMMTGRVRENVYDSATGKHLLVPQGTTIVGTYDSVATFGQQRLLVAWQRLIFPDGTKLNIGAMPGVDLSGAAGFEDQVDRHYRRLFGGALLLSAITAGATLSQDDGGGGFERSTAERVQDTLASALGANLAAVSSELVRREMNVQPTLKIRPGYRFNVFVQKDMIFEGPYRNTFVGGLIP